MKYEQLARRDADAVAVVTITNPPAGYMDEQTEAELAHCVAALEADDGVRAVVLTGGLPGVFIRHYSVEVLEARGRDMRERGLAFTLDRYVPEAPIHRILAAIEASPKPYVAALNGTAMGGGFELALACDLRIAEDGPYRLGLPEVNIGLLPGAGGTQRLSALVGPGRALELVLCGRTLSPPEALAQGLVHECGSEPACERAERIARELAAKPALALAHVKRLIREFGRWGREEGFARERTLFCDLMVDPESIERMAAMNRGERDIVDS